MSEWTISKGLLALDNEALNGSPENLENLQVSHLMGVWHILRNNFDKMGLDGCARHWCHMCGSWDGLEVILTWRLFDKDKSPGKQ